MAWRAKLNMTFASRSLLEISQAPTSVAQRGGDPRVVRPRTTLIMATGCHGCVTRYEIMHVFVRSTLAGRAALADGWFQVFDQVYHLDVRLWMPADATVAKDWVASCDPSTAEALPCSASRAADVTSTIWSRSWPAAAVSCSGMMSEHPQVLATFTRALLRR